MGVCYQNSKKNISPLLEMANCQTGMQCGWKDMTHPVKNNVPSLDLKSRLLIKRGHNWCVYSTQF